MLNSTRDDPNLDSFGRVEYKQVGGKKGKMINLEVLKDRTIKLCEAIRIIKMIVDLDLVDYLKKLFEETEAMKKAEIEKKIIDREVGIKIGTYLLENISQIEDDLYNFIAMYADVDINEAKNIDLDVFIELIQCLVKNGLPKIIMEFFKKKGISYFQKETPLSN